MNQGWHAGWIFLWLALAGLIGFALTYLGRLIFNLTSNDDTDPDHPVFRGANGHRFTGIPLLRASAGEAFGFIFMSHLGFFIGISLTTLICLGVAASGSLDVSDVIHDLAYGNQSDRVDWNQAQWLVAFAVAGLVTAGYGLYALATLPKSAAGDSAHSTH